MNDSNSFSSDALGLARTFFLLAAILHAIIALPLTLVSMGMSRGGDGSVLAFVICGGAYIYGSLMLFRADLPFGSLVWLGWLINLIGAGAWLPDFIIIGGHPMAIFPVFLHGMWAWVLLSQYRDERG